MKKVAKTVLIGMCVCFLIGLVLVLSSTGIGRAAGWRALTSSDWSDEADETYVYEKIIETTIQDCQIGGGLLMFFGGIGALVQYVLLWKREA